MKPYAIRMDVCAYMCIDRSFERIRKGSCETFHHQLSQSIETVFEFLRYVPFHLRFRSLVFHVVRSPFSHSRDPTDVVLSSKQGRTVSSSKLPLNDVIRRSELKTKDLFNFSVRNEMRNSCQVTDASLRGKKIERLVV